MGRQRSAQRIRTPPPRSWSARSPVGLTEMFPSPSRAGRLPTHDPRSPAPTAAVAPAGRLRLPRRLPLRCPRPLGPAVAVVAPARRPPRRRRSRPQSNLLPARRHRRGPRQSRRAPRTSRQSEISPILDDARARSTGRPTRRTRGRRRRLVRAQAHPTTWRASSRSRDPRRRQAAGARPTRIRGSSPDTRRTSRSPAVTPSEAVGLPSRLGLQEDRAHRLSLSFTTPNRKTWGAGVANHWAQ